MAACIPLILSLALFPVAAAPPNSVSLPLAPGVGPTTFWADFDGNGRSDVYAIYAAGYDRLYRNLGDGTFQDATAEVGLAYLSGSRAALWADIDRDGMLDLYLVSGRTDRRLFLNQGQAGFVDVTLGSGLAREGEDILGAWVDYDADGHPDLMLRTTTGDRLFHNLGGVRFELVPFDLPAGAGASASSQGVVTGLPDGVPGGLTVQPGIAAGSSLAWSTFLVPWTTGLGQGLDLTGRGLLNGSSPAPAPLGCTPSIADQAQPGNCIQASTVPVLGSLYPMTDDLNVSGAGDVGIGTSSPGAKLDVNGTIQGQGTFQSAPNGDVRLNANGAGRNALLQSNGTTVLTAEGSTRNVGIGTTSTPVARLEVRDDGAPGTARTILALRTAESAAGTEGRLDWMQSGSVSGRISNAFEAGSQLGLAFSTYFEGLAERMRITASGRVGIGTATPASTLHVQSPGVVAATFDSAGHTRVRISTPSSSLNPKVEFNRAGGNLWEIGVDDSYGSGGLYVFGGTSQVRRMGIKPNGDVILADVAGNVGIGTQSPTSRLQVAGTIHSTSGGFRFPDGSVQTVAYPGTATGIASINGQTGPGITIQGGSGISISTSGNVVTVAVSQPTACNYDGHLYTVGAVCMLGSQGACTCGVAPPIGCACATCSAGNYVQTCQANGTFSGPSLVCFSAPICGI